MVTQGLGCAGTYRMRYAVPGKRDDTLELFRCGRQHKLVLLLALVTVQRDRKSVGTLHQDNVQLLQHRMDLLV